MSQSTLSVRMDDDLKKNFDTVCSELGITMSTAVTMLAKTVTRNHGLPSELCKFDPFYSESNMKALKESIEQEKQGKMVYKTWEELEAMANG